MDKLNSVVAFVNEVNEVEADDTITVMFIDYSRSVSSKLIVSGDILKKYSDDFQTHRSEDGIYVAFFFEFNSWPCIYYYNVLTEQLNCIEFDFIQYDAFSYSSLDIQFSKNNKFLVFGLSSPSGETKIRFYDLYQKVITYESIRYFNSFFLSDNGNFLYITVDDKLKKIDVTTDKEIYSFSIKSLHVVRDADDRFFYMTDGKNKLLRVCAETCKTLKTWDFNEDIYLLDSENSLIKAMSYGKEHRSFHITSDDTIKYYDKKSEVNITFTTDSLSNYMILTVENKEMKIPLKGITKPILLNGYTYSRNPVHNIYTQIIMVIPATRLLLSIKRQDVTCSICDDVIYEIVKNLVYLVVGSSTHGVSIRGNLHIMSYQLSKFIIAFCKQIPSNLDGQTKFDFLTYVCNVLF